ncbi:hypothetical protein KCU90_g164, partial [Aureobasidium melanogenum]
MFSIPIRSRSVEQPYLHISLGPTSGFQCCFEYAGDTCKIGPALVRHIRLARFALRLFNLPMQMLQDQHVVPVLTRFSASYCADTMNDGGELPCSTDELQTLVVFAVSTGPYEAFGRVSLRALFQGESHMMPSTTEFDIVAASQRSLVIILGLSRVTKTFGHIEKLDYYPNSNTLGEE